MSEDFICPKCGCKNYELKPIERGLVVHACSSCKHYEQPKKHVIKPCKKEERQPDFWLSPSGEWYNLGIGSHTFFACAIVEQFYPDSIEAKDAIHHDCNLFLIRHGWKKVDSDRVLALTTENHVENFKLTSLQFQALLDYYQDKPVVRGKTITEIYYENNPAP